jgi:hypothetical protein
MRRLILALGLLLAALPSPAFAWWEYGHRTVGAIALRTVQPRTRAAIRMLLAHSRQLDTPTCPAATIEEAAVWPDCVKTLGDRFSYAYSWHFQDVDICKPFDLHSACAGGNCVSAQIARAQRMVADRALPVRERLMALIFLVHFTGDLHQPLHGAEHDGDQGGNKLRLAYGAIPRTNLHAVWDGLLADRAISTAPAGAAGLLSEVPATERKAMAAGTVEDWSRESWQLARDQAYGGVAPDLCANGVPAHPKLTEARIEELLPVVRRQIVRGGLRLARLLDEALDGDHPEVAHPPRPARAAVG